jgi:hypothetical protein
MARGRERLVFDRVTGQVVPARNQRGIGIPVVGRRLSTAGGEVFTPSELHAKAEFPVDAVQNWAQPCDNEAPGAIPWDCQADSRAKDYGDCNAEERDGRWRDSVEALTAWQAKSLALGGEDYGTALAKASETQQAVAANARAAEGIP